jgi:signal recognition particle receptor subunit beta
MLGFVVLVDSNRPETFREAQRILDTFRNYSPVPYIVAANKQDLDDSWPPEDLRIVLKVEPDVKVVPCVACERESVKQVLLELLYSILDIMDHADE